MKSVENILGYILEAVSLEKMFEIFQENIQNWFIFKQQKTMQQDLLLHFGWYFYLEMWKKYSVVQL